MISYDFLCFSYGDTTVLYGSIIMVIRYGFISSIYMYLYVFIMVIPWFILFYTVVLLRFYHGLYPLVI